MKSLQAKTLCPMKCSHNSVSNAMAAEIAANVLAFDKIWYNEITRG